MLWEEGACVIDSKYDPAYIMTRYFGRVVVVSDTIVKIHFIYTLFTYTAVISYTMY